MRSMLQAPALIALLVLASFVAVIVHLWMGRSVRDLLLLWVASAAGCGAGHLLGEELGLIPWTLGQVHVVEAGIGGVLLALAAAWLRPQAKPQGGAKQ